MTTTKSPDATPYTRTVMGLDQVKATLRDRLGRLPDDPDAIADFLLERDHLGEVNSACRCPMALYLSDDLGSNYAVRVDDLDRQASVLGGGLIGRLLHTEPLPGGALDFIGRFDDRKYPELIRRFDDQCPV
ncbi:MAG: hypothetical protein ACRDNL_00710 [Spirillospora sp.]